jgi:hypothetical protein
VTALPVAPAQRAAMAVGVHGAAAGSLERRAATLLRHTRGTGMGAAHVPGARGALRAGVAPSRAGRIIDPLPNAVEAGYGWIGRVRIAQSHCTLRITISDARAAPTHVLLIFAHARRMPHRTTDRAIAWRRVRARSHRVGVAARAIRWRVFARGSSPPARFRRSVSSVAPECIDTARGVSPACVSLARASGGSTGVDQAPRSTSPTRAPLPRRTTRSTRVDRAGRSTPPTSGRAAAIDRAA